MSSSDDEVVAGLSWGFVLKLNLQSPESTIEFKNEEPDMIDVEPNSTLTFPDDMSSKKLQEKKVNYKNAQITMNKNNISAPTTSPKKADYNTSDDDLKQLWLKKKELSKKEEMKDIQSIDRSLKRKLETSSTSPEAIVYPKTKTQIIRPIPQYPNGIKKDFFPLADKEKPFVFF